MYDILINFRKRLMVVYQDVENKVQVASAGFSISLESVLQVGFNQFRKAPGIFILHTLISGIVLSNPVSGLLLGGPVLAGFYLASDNLRQGKPVEVKDLLQGLNLFIPLLLVTLLVSLVTAIGFLLLILPGIYFSVSYLFAHLFVLFYDVPATEAIHLSRKTISGNFPKMLLLWLVLAGINMLGALAFGVGLLITIPFSFCVIHAAFDDIIGIPKS
jgi:hypothetical protein